MRSPAACNLSLLHKRTLAVICSLPMPSAGVNFLQGVKLHCFECNMIGRKQDFRLVSIDLWNGSQSPECWLAVRRRFWIGEMITGSISMARRGYDWQTNRTNKEYPSSISHSVAELWADLPSCVADLEQQWRLDFPHAQEIPLHSCRDFKFWSRSAQGAEEMNKALRISCRNLCKAVPSQEML